jgi:hypothetical protein
LSNLSNRVVPMVAVLPAAAGQIYVIRRHRRKGQQYSLTPYRAMYESWLFIAVVPILLLAWVFIR